MTITTLTGYLAAAMMIFPAVTVAAGVKDPTVNLVKELRDRAADADRRSDSLQKFIRSGPVSRETQAYTLAVLRDDVNTMGKIVERFDALTPSSTTPDERAAVAEAVPLLRNIAAYTNSAIVMLNNDPDPSLVPMYRGYVRNLSMESDRLSKQTGQFLGLMVARTKEAHIESQLKAAAGA